MDTKRLPVSLLFFAAIGVYSLIDGRRAFAFADAASLVTLAMCLALVVFCAVVLYFVDKRRNPSIDRERAGLLVRIDNFLRITCLIGAVSFIAGLIIATNFDFNNRTLGWILRGSFLGVGMATVGALGHAFIGAYLSPIFRQVFETALAAEFESNHNHDE